MSSVLDLFHSVKQMTRDYAVGFIINIYMGVVRIDIHNTVASAKWMENNSFD